MVLSTIRGNVNGSYCQSATIRTSTYGGKMKPSNFPQRINERRHEAHARLITRHQTLVIERKQYQTGSPMFEMLSAKITKTMEALETLAAKLKASLRDIRTKKNRSSVRGLS